MRESPTPVTRLVELRRMTGTWFFVIAFAARLPVAMNVVGVLTLVTVVRGSLADAGLVSAAVGLASGIGGPLLAALADRAGQRPVLLVTAPLHAALLVVLVAVVYADATVPLLVTVAALAGAALPPASPMTRARWLVMLDRDTRRGGRGVPIALGYESMADEISFVGGPVLVGALATGAGPAMPVYFSAALAIVCVTAFALHPSAKLVHRTDDGARVVAAPGRELLGARVLLPTAGMVALGAFFASTLASATAYTESVGAAESTGLVYAAMGITSSLAAILVERLPRGFTTRSRWVVAAAGMTAVALVMPFVAVLPGIVATFALVGVAVGANLVTLFTLAAHAAPSGRLATTMTMLSSGVIVGQAVTMALVSRLAEANGVVAAFWVVPGTAAAGLLLALVHLMVVRPRGRSSTLERQPA